MVVLPLAPRGALSLSLSLAHIRQGGQTCVRMDVMNDRSTGSSQRQTGIVCGEEHRKTGREENKEPLRPRMSPDRVGFSSSAQHQPSHGSSLPQRVSQMDQEPQLPSCCGGPAQPLAAPDGLPAAQEGLWECDRCRGVSTVACSSCPLPSIFHLFHRQGVVTCFFPQLPSSRKLTGRTMRRWESHAEMKVG